MKNIAGVRFKKPGKIYFFDPGDLKIEKEKSVAEQLQISKIILTFVTSLKRSIINYNSL